jgi:hypothetical protein
LLRSAQSFSFPADINVEQYDRASRDARFRLEIVANHTAARNGSGTVERLTLTADDIRARARPSQYRLPLNGLEGRIRR